MCCIAVLAFILALSEYAAADGSQVDIDWVALGNAYRQYERAPNAKNAEAVWRLLPIQLDAAGIGGSKDEQGVIEYLLDHLSAIKKQVIVGDESAVRLAFRLGVIADGDLGEELDQILSSQIATRPRLFLRMLKENRRIVPRLDSLTAINRIYDDPAADCQDLLRKKNALRNVKNPELAATRDEAIRQLEKSMENDCKGSNSM